ncbi:unnamed protein product [Boreogadus saida]
MSCSAACSGPPGLSAWELRTFGTIGPNHNPNGLWLEFENSFLEDFAERRSEVIAVSTTTHTHKCLSTPTRPN